MVSSFRIVKPRKNLHLKIVKLKDHPFGYKYNVQDWYKKNLKGKKQFVHNGQGKFLKDKTALKKYIKSKKG